MPYPPRPQRKHATAREADRARAKALAPYRFKPGQSGNPIGFPRGRREQLEMIEQLARQASPEMIGILQDLARNSSDERVRTMAATKLLEFLPKRPYTPEIEASARSFGEKSAAELRQELIGICEDISRIDVSQVEVPEDFEPSEEDRERYAVVRAALLMAVTGVQLRDGRLIDTDAFREAAERETDERRKRKMALGLVREKRVIGF